MRLGGVAVDTHNAIDYRPTMQLPPFPEDAITLAEMCELTGISASGWRTIRHRKQDAGVHRWYVGREVFYSRAEVVAWIDGSRCPTCNQPTRISA
jgi:predicted DNA-binding transcriptional regulator AlpA